MTKRKKSVEAAPVTRVVLEHPEMAALDLEVQRPAGKPGCGGRKARPADIGKWLDRARVLGVQTRLLVWELHVVQGRHRLETARLLKISPQRVEVLYAEARRELLARAPTTEEDFIIQREELKERLLATYEDACSSDDPRHLLIRLRALEQLARVQGLITDLQWVEKRKAAAEATLATTQHTLSPEDQRQLQNLSLEMFGRLEDVQAIERVRTRAMLGAGGHERWATSGQLSEKPS